MSESERAGREGEREGERERESETERERERERRQFCREAKGTGGNIDTFTLGCSPLY